MEATLSLGILSIGALTLMPLYVLGLQIARQAQDTRDEARMAQSLIEQARQGTLSSGTTYLDLQGSSTTVSQAVYTAQSTIQPVTGSSTLDRLTLKITPLSAPDRARTYAVVYSAP